MGTTDWENLQKNTEKTGLPINLEALIGQTEDCEHRMVSITSWTEVEPYYYLSEEICCDCGKLVGIRSRRVQP